MAYENVIADYKRGKYKDLDAEEMKQKTAAKKRRKKKKGTKKSPSKAETGYY